MASEWRWTAHLLKAARMSGVDNAAYRKLLWRAVVLALALCSLLNEDRSRNLHLNGAFLIVAFIWSSHSGTFARSGYFFIVAEAFTLYLVAIQFCNLLRFIFMMLQT